MKKILLVAGARPNFMKIAPLWHELDSRRDRCRPLLVHTGQHYDRNMSEVFFRDLGLPEPDIHLGVGAGSHAEQTGRIMIAFEAVCREQEPDLVVVVGDVNSTLACTVTAKKLWIPVAHVEAGLRSRNMRMPEEINRLVTDALADHLFTPSPDADANLRAEGVAAERIVLVGNIMIDSLARATEKAADRKVSERFGLPAGGYGLVTLHRPGNVDGEESLKRIFRAMHDLPVPLIFPVHPRTRKMLESYSMAEELGADGGRIHMTDPMPYLDFVDLTARASFVLTDSGGIQEETTWLGVPCLTLRPETERPITVTEGTNELVTVESMADAVERIRRGAWKKGRIPALWDGRTAERIADHLLGS